MAEPIRLVIWDLDETFWEGTLSEGGITYSKVNHDLVVALARRGIVSAICSKNDMEAAKAVLAEKGIWNYFVFPSIDWNPKGPRIKTLIEDIGLRPETVLFIDDNPLNRREAQHFVPGLEVADVDIITTMLASSLFEGKNDKSMSRLDQYKVLQTRRADAAVAADDLEFLRSCDIKVEIERDIEPHIDRAIELINRTNQLNFTKKRLPEDSEQARGVLNEMLAHFTTQAALVRVTDRYGDYGYCGFYLTTTQRGRSRLRHFCFSCRILNMGVERWMYTRLGRPPVRVVGEVLANLADETPVDWIGVASPEPAAVETNVGKARRGVLIRGSCNVAPLVHYFTMDTEETVGEFNDVRDNVHVRNDHSLILRYAIEGVGDDRLRILERLGYRAEDFKTRFAELDRSWPRILAFWIDSRKVVYRHRHTGLLIPFDIHGSVVRKSELATLDPDSVDAAALPAPAREAVRFLSEECEPVGAIPEEDHQQTLDVIFGAVPEGAKIFVLKAPGARSRAGQKQLNRLNERIEAAAQRYRDRVETVATSSLVGSDEDTGKPHLHRKTYYKLYRLLCARMDGVEFASGKRFEEPVAMQS